MTVVSLQEAQATLSELIHGLGLGEEVLIVENDQPVARLTPAGPAGPGQGKRRLGTLQGTVLYMAPDFNAPLDDSGYAIRRICD